MINKVKIKYVIKSSYLFQRLYRYRLAKRTNKNLICIYDRKIPNTYCKILEKVNIKIEKNNVFQYWIDKNLYFCHFENILGNMPPNFAFIIHSSLAELKEKVMQCPNTYGLKDIEGSFLDAIESYIFRIILKLDFAERDCVANQNLISARRCFKGMLYRDAEDLFDALQRILFWDSIFWQTGHQLVGLGRLDVILDSFSEEAECNIDKAKKQIDEFLLALHKYYSFKSATLKGDTGQIIILGGKKSDGTYFSNIFTKLFIESCKDLHLPDPKCLLRASRAMPRMLMDLSLGSLVTGIGGPVLANDDVIISSLEKLGYSHEKACNYAFSACWEPLSYGDSFGQNNFPNINFGKCVIDALEEMEKKNFHKWGRLIDLFYQKLGEQVKKICDYSNKKQWEIDPLFSLLTEGCIESGIDISKGGALNNDFGILSVGFPNAVNSLLNIKSLVYDQKKYSLVDLREAQKSNFSTEKGKEIYAIINSLPSSFGHDDKFIIDFCNSIIVRTNQELGKFRNSLGGHFKFGLSSPAYIDMGKSTSATLDGRLSGEPFNTHISVNDGSISFTELLSFASKLTYDGYTANGNVVDIFVNPYMIEANHDKFITLFLSAIKSGVYEIQVNVVSSRTLTDAKIHPERYTNLIVRVWGFSAYFNDLPKDYQDLLIKRAVESERN